MSELKFYSFYHRETGAIHPHRFATDDETQLAANIPLEHIAIPGDHDHRAARYDIALRRVVPIPIAQETEAEKAEAAHAQTIRDIWSLEASQARAVREAILTGDRTRLQEIDQQIAALRANLQAGKNEKRAAD